MKRTDLLTKLELVAPALAAHDILPISTHFWFTGKRLMAYRSQIAISTPFETDFACAVPGAMLLNLIKATGAKDIDLQMGSNELQVKGGSMRAKLKTLPSELFNFKMPKPPQVALETNGEEFIAGIKTCMRAVSLDTTRPDFLGVTILPGKNSVDMYGSGGNTMSRATVKFKGAPPFPQHAIIPNLFCTELLKLAKGTKKLRMSMSNDTAGQERVMFAGDDVTMYGQLVDCEKPLKFTEIFSKFHPPGSKLVPISSKLSHILERACIVASSDAATVRTVINVTKGRGKFVTASRMGAEVTDEMVFPEGHPDVEIEVDAKPIKEECADFTRMLITDRCFTLAGANDFYLVAGRDH